MFVPFNLMNYRAFFLTIKLIEASFFLNYKNYKYS